MDHSIYKIPALVLRRLSEYVPPRLQFNQWQLANLEWADKELASTKTIGIILGADVYPQLMLEGVWKSADGALLAQSTTLGWILVGILNNNVHMAKKHLHCCAVDKKLLRAVEKFWKVEEPSLSNDPEDEEVESYYQATTERIAEGRFIVRLPFKGNPSSLGESSSAAKKCNFYLQNRLLKSQELNTLYQQFMSEYSNLDHMELISSAEIPHHHYFLPHHTILRPSSTTTKLRVVFNASKPTSSGVSLNDILHVGPQLLPHLHDVILRWKRHRIVFSTDIEKMYRQILIHKADRNFQLIFFDNGYEEQIYRLRTVTYGTASAPYLDMRTLRQLADEEREFPRASEIIKRDIYMNDILSGADDVTEALEIQEELIQLLKKGGFQLRKWTSNSPELVEPLPASLRAKSVEPHLFPSEVHSMLGLKWQSLTDQLIVHSSLNPITSPITKRVVLSAIAKLFDPLGFAAPVLIKAKIFLQSLWLLKLAWDDRLPEEQANTWHQIYDDLLVLYLQVPRWLGCISRRPDVKIFGFADASEKAMAAVLYIVSPTAKEARLLGAKTKLAPLKQISLPRLELNAAVVLVRLTKQILISLELDPPNPLYLWSDSTTVLSWIASHPSKWQTYVANRVSEIQTTLPTATWLYVPTAQNPADCATRGLSSNQLKNYCLWWTGPSWITQNQNSWPNQLPVRPTEAPEQRKYFKTSHHITRPTFVDDFTNRFSCFLRLLRTTAYILRYLNKIQTGSLRQGPLTGEELREAKFRLTKGVQRTAFVKEFSSLTARRPISNQSLLIKLNPFVDSAGLLRVGGRLKHSLLDPAEKHPIILPYKHQFTILVIRDAHKRTLRGGVQLTLGTLRREWWILRGRQAVKSIIYNCVTPISENGRLT